MNRTLAIIILLIGAGCAADSQEIKHHHTNTAQDSVAYAMNPYRLSLELEALENNQYALTAAMEIDSGCWFASPHSAAHYKGYFSMKLHENNFLLLDSSFLEVPPSALQKDKWMNEMTHVVVENTTYTQTLKVNSTEDFKVLGMIQFVIEPKCTLEQIPFSISNVEGKLSVQKYPKIDRTTCDKVN
ncbi:MAG: hypothetical protein K9J17_12485 [Flavobacteriales bacterium]|nr:hypothetical protein [Flavobacteriales bacterium]